MKLRHRFIFVTKLRPISTFHNCKDDYKRLSQKSFSDNLKLDHGKIALFTLHTHTFTHLRLLYNKDSYFNKIVISNKNSGVFWCKYQYSLTYAYIIYPLIYCLQKPTSIIKSPSADAVPRCPYGKQCYRKNPVHFKEYSHDDENDADEDENGEDRPECQYGTSCYR